MRFRPPHHPPAHISSVAPAPLPRSWEMLRGGRAAILASDGGVLPVGAERARCPLPPTGPHQHTFAWREAGKQISDVATYLITGGAAERGAEMNISAPFSIKSNEIRQHHTCSFQRFDLLQSGQLLKSYLFSDCDLFVQICCSLEGENCIDLLSTVHWFCTD